MSTSALFLDRDGVINKRIMQGYVRTVEEFILIKGIQPCIELARAHNMKVIVVTNQQGVAKGLMTIAELAAIHAHMKTLIHVDAVYAATEMASREPYRRKPSPTMFYEAKEDFGVDLTRSIMIGDSVSDAQAAHAAGCSAILIGKHNPEHAEIVVPSVYKAAKGLELLIEKLKIS